eukprot:g4563.t1
MRLLCRLLVSSFVDVQELPVAVFAVRVPDNASKSFSCGDEEDHTSRRKPVETPGFKGTGLPDPPLTSSADKRLDSKFKEPSYHGYRMAFEAGRKFAHTPGQFHVKSVSAEELSSFVFVLSPMRRAVETGAEFIKGYHNALAEEVGKGPEARKQELREWTDESMGAFASKASIILAPDVREARGLFVENLGTPVADWDKRGLLNVPFTQTAFVVQNTNAYSWVNNDSDAAAWPDNGKQDSESLQWPDLGKGIAATEVDTTTGGHGKRTLRGFIQDRLFTDDRFKGKTVFIVSHSHTMYEQFKLHYHNGTLIGDEEWVNTNSDYAQTIVFDVKGGGDGKKGREQMQKERYLSATAVYEPEKFAPR